MYEYLIICIAALLGSGLTFFSGFGLGTILVPVFGLFFPIELAILMTAIVHFLNNLFKLALVGKGINWNVVFRFGIPSILAAFLGAYLLLSIDKLQPMASYEVGGHVFFITPINLIIAAVLAIFAVLEILPAVDRLHIGPRFMPIGGLLSGFFGGLSGHQGALRSLFLIRSGLDKQSFIATGILIACLVDVTRLLVYANAPFSKTASIDYTLLIAATLSAFAGAYAGNRMLKKMTIKTLQYLVAVMMLLFALALGVGLV